MVGDGSLYDALGLDPDADDAAIERAYKRLIKEHHPDRLGGDGDRAAEINRAYRQLRAERGLQDPLELNDDWFAAGGQGAAWVLLALLVAATAAFLLFTQSPLFSPQHRFDSASPVGLTPRSRGHSAGSMDEPLRLSLIRKAVADAVGISRSSDELALASYSRDCHGQLRASPTIAQLDRCAAFDDAVVQLQDRDPLRDQGPFSELAVTGRIWSSASALSDDSLATDARLDRIRLQVEIALAPTLGDVARPAKP